jgi:hypothetical protein
LSTWLTLIEALRKRADRPNATRYDSATGEVQVRYWTADALTNLWDDLRTAQWEGRNRFGSPLEPARVTLPHVWDYIEVRDWARSVLALMEPREPPIRTEQWPSGSISVYAPQPREIALLYDARFRPVPAAITRQTVKSISFDEVETWLRSLDRVPSQNDAEALVRDAPQFRGRFPGRDLIRAVIRKLKGNKPGPSRQS